MKKKQSSLWSANETYKKNSQLEKFCTKLEEKKLFKKTSNFKDLWLWSIKNPSIFWSEVWDFTKIKGIKKGVSIKKNKIFYKNIFFPEAKINYAENLLVKKNNQTAINFLSECGIEKNITWKQLYENVCKFSYYLKKIKLKEKERVAAYVPNTIEAVTAFLATSKNGRIWSSCSPAFGADGVIDRFAQIKPKVLITCEYYLYNGKKINILEKIPKILKKIKSIKKNYCFSIQR